MGLAQGVLAMWPSNEWPSMWHRGLQMDYRYTQVNGSWRGVHPRPGRQINKFGLVN